MFKSHQLYSNGNFSGIVTATTLSSGNVFVGTATSTGTFVA
jgi:hypothetical protein